MFKTFAQRAPLLLDFYQGIVRDSSAATIFQKIDEITKVANKNKDEDLLLETALMRAHYFYYRDTIFSRKIILGKLDSLKQVGIDKKKALAGDYIRKYAGVLQL
ncbi:MAG: hypothetical protein ABI581_16825 [Sediminibacterium sp.]